MARHDLRDTGGRFMRNPTMDELEAAGVFAKDIEGWIVASEVVREAKIVKAREVAEYWQSISPHWGDKDPKEATPPTGQSHGHGVPNYPGGYADSIKVFEHEGTVSVGTELIPLAVFLEYGTEKMEEAACGRRTLEHFGGGPVDGAERVTDKLFVG